MKIPIRWKFFIYNVLISAFISTNVPWHLNLLSRLTPANDQKKYFAILYENIDLIRKKPVYSMTMNKENETKKNPLYIIIFYILGYLIATFFIWKRFRQIRRKWKPSNETIMFLVKSVCWKRVRQSFQMMGWINWLHTNYLLCQDIVLHTWCNFTTNMIYT